MAGLAEAVQGTVGQPASVRIGVVDSVSPLAISAQGVPFNDVGLLGDYAPQVGDSVALLGQSSGVGSDPASWLALGAVHDALTPSIEPVLLNGWVNFDPANWAPVSHWRDAGGVVHIEGLVRDGVVGTIFMLPEGSRPPLPLIFTMWADTVAGACRIDVNPDGAVVASTGTSASYTSLSGISFRAAPYPTVAA